MLFSAPRFALLVAPLIDAAAISATTYSKTTTFAFAGTTLPTGLTASSQLIGDSGNYQHQYVPQNAYVSGGYLNLLVNGTQASSGIVTSGQVKTSFTIKSARVDTFAILSAVPGVCNGMFMYANDNQETDIEWLSDPASTSNNKASLGTAIWYMNQATTTGQDPVSSPKAVPSDATTAVHNYSLTWNAGYTAFYLDNVLHYKYTTDMPTATTGQWMWNNWSNGNKGWSAGPPTTNSIFKIQKIAMLYNPGS